VKLIGGEKTDCFTAFRVSKSLLAQIDKACEELDLTRSQLFRRSVEEFLAARDSRPASHVNASASTRPQIRFGWRWLGNRES
jgi:hypothetical protein